MARRIAEIHRETGPYDMIYFDGAEDVHRPFWHHVASAQNRVYRLLDPPPPVCEAAHYTHFSWHMITRSNAYDTVAPSDGMKAFCRLMPCPTAAARSMDFSRIDFGWLGRFGQSRSGCAGPDVYEYLDCPTWVHTTRWSKWKGPLFDPGKLETEAARRELFELGSRYYKVTHDAIRRYDKHHLILGDRYEGQAPLPEEVIKAAAPYVDVLSFQHFSLPEQVRRDLERWNALTGKPVLLWNVKVRCPTTQ